MCHLVGGFTGGSGCGSLVQLEMTCALQIFGVSLATIYKFQFKLASFIRMGCPPRGGNERIILGGLV